MREFDRCPEQTRREETFQPSAANPCNYRTGFRELPSLTSGTCQRGIEIDTTSSSSCRRGSVASHHLSESEGFCF